MPAYTQEMAQKYYDGLPAGEKQKVDAIGGPSVQWFTNAVQAGVPDAVQATGSSKSVYTGEGDTGSYADWGDAAEASEWYGKRKPTPAELRKWAADQHAKYVAGDKNSQDEDYERFDDRTLAGWINEKWDVGKGGFYSPNGERIGKPPDVDSKGVNAYGETVGGAGGGAGGGAANKPPPEPVKVGNQLSLTGNPMQDMLLTQFNQGQNNTFDKGNNIFGLGEDRAVGGTGANADKQSQIQGQSLTGGGVWWGQGADAFGGWNAAEDKQLAGTQATGEQNQAQKQYDPNAVKAADNSVKLPSPTQPTQTTSKPVDPRRPTSPTTTYYAGGNMNQKPPDQSRTIAGMMTNSFSGNA
jgi:hypothetical protein